MAGTWGASLEQALRTRDGRPRPSGAPFMFRRVRAFMLRRDAVSTNLPPITGSPVVGIVGRQAELSALRALLDRMPEAGGAMLVHGDPGIGKSTLLSAAEDEGRQRGFGVLRTAGSEVEADLSFAGLHRLLHPVLEYVGELPPRQRDALLVAFGQADGPPPERFLLALAVLELLAAAAAGRPLLVLAEDVHWLDRASADALAFVARRMGSDPIVLLAASRRGPELWPGDSTVPAVRLEPLGATEAQALLGRSQPGGPAQQRRILELAAGNPLALVELPRALRGGGASDDPLGLPVTARLDRAFAARASEVSAATRSILLVTALEEGLWIADALRAAQAAGAVREQDVDPAVEVGLLDASDGRLRFRHPLMRSAIQAQVSQTARRAAHAALRAVLADQPGRAVWHRAYACLAGDEGLAQELADAAAVALGRGALAEAARRLERASQLTAEVARRVPWVLEAAELAAQLNDRELADRLLGQLTVLDVCDRARRERVRETFAEISDADEPRIRALVDLADGCARAQEPALALDLLLAAALRCFWAQPSHAARDAVVRAAEAVGMPPGTPKLLAVLGVADPLGRGASVAAHLTALGVTPIGVV